MNYWRMMSPVSTDLVKKLNARETIREFHRACDLVRKGYAVVQEAKEALDSTFLLGGERVSRFSIQERHGREPHWENPEDTIVELERQAWWQIVERLELRQFLSIKRWEELKRNLSDGNMPPLTENSAIELVRSFHDQFDTLLEESVTEVYAWLRPWREKYKTNSPFQVGAKVILEYCVEAKYVRPGFQVVYEKQQRLVALENVFRALDGKGQVSKSYSSELENAIKDSESGDGTTPYFRFKCFKNRNLHLSFVRPDLVERLNQVAGRGLLRNSPG